ncbi:MAG: preprotein translocase subunit SecA [Micromonosporaceae bacterium]
MSIFEKILRAGEGRMVRRLSSIAAAVNSIEDDYTDLTDAELRALTDQFRERHEDGMTLDDLLPEAFAVAREAAHRVLGQRHYDVQVMGGAALHFGNIAEMKTGEGKTLTCVLPAYLNGLTGDGVHVVTVNDYLAQRDAEWMGQVHQFLGLSVGVILPNEPSSKHRDAYACDITYGTNNEFGFDYLRDNMTASHADLVQRGHHFAIVDEVDSILVDEARTPLIISGPAAHSQRWYAELSRISRKLTGFDSTKLIHRERQDLLHEINTKYDYEIDQSKRTVAVSERGVRRVEDELGIENLYDPVNTHLVGYLNNALKAKELYAKDKDYIVNDDGEVLIVDEFTGRILHGRRYSEGMHQAIEAKEGVAIKQENQTLATITLQNYFRMYDKLSGMTGTAKTEEAEFNKVYKVGVVSIPTHRPMVRLDHPDVVYKTELAKFEAVVDDIVERHEQGQPILVGTTSVEKSEVLAAMLKRRGVSAEVLNAKYHAREAEIIAQAGRKGAVTVATNMAGRGTDILLGGNPEFAAAAELRQQGLDPEEHADAYAEAWEGALKRAKVACEDEAEEVLDAGGLYVLGTERHESRRIDNQLRGRSGRQGDPGESRFYLSLQDDLMKRFNAAAVQAVMDRLNIPDDVPIESKLVSRQIKSAQTQIESQNAEIRKDVLKYDDVMNNQRQVIYAERDRVLDGEDVHEQITHMIDDVIGAYVTGATGEGYAEDWDLDELWEALGRLYPISLTVEELEDEAGGLDALDAETLIEHVKEDAHAAYDRREEELGEETLRELERQVLLEVIDQKWREHLYEMDYLREGVGLRAYAQRDPLVEYQREGFDMFATMLEGIKEDTVKFVFNAQVQVEAAPSEQVDKLRTAVSRPALLVKGLEHRQPEKLQYSAPAIDGEAGSGTAVVEEEAPALGIGADRRDRKDRRMTGRAGTGVAKSTASARTAATARRAGPASPTAAGDRRVSSGQQTGTAPSRNAPCPCGSGKKYKRCHGAPGQS